MRRHTARATLSLASTLAMAVTAVLAGAPAATAEQDGTPEPPSNVRVTTSPGEVVVDWDPPTGGPAVDLYTATLTGPSNWVDRPSVETEDTTAEFTVPSGGDLTLLLRARSESQRWKWSDYVRVEFTLEPGEGWEPVAPPSNLRAVFDGAEAERLEWDPASGGTGTLTYQTYYRFSPADPRPFPWFTTDDTFITSERLLLSVEWESCESSHARTTKILWSVSAVSDRVESDRTDEVVLCTNSF